MNPSVILTHDATGMPITFITQNIANIMVAPNGKTLVKLMNGRGYYVSESVPDATVQLRGSEFYV